MISDAVFFIFNPCWLLSDRSIFYQSAALPSLAVPVQTWKSVTSKMNTLASTAAAASAQIHLGSALLVFSTQQLDPDSGSQSHFALQEAAAAKVSAEKIIVQFYPLINP